MRAVLVRSLLVIGAGGLVLAGVLYVASTVDARAPTVLEVGLTQPLPDDSDRALITTSIEITFSEPVELEGAAGAITLEPAVDGSLAPAGSTLIFTPGEPLELETEYVLTVAAGITDSAGNEMSQLPEPYRFVTAGRPSLASSEPADGADDVPVDAVIGLVFTGLMDTASVEAALELSPDLDYEVRWSGERLEIDPAEPLEPGSEVTVTIGESATDVAGVRIADAVSVAFRAVAPGLGAARVIPADGSGGISPHTPIAIIFDRPIDPDSVESEVLVVTPSVAGTVEAVARPDDPASTRVLTFTPTAPLPANTTFEVRLVGEVETSAGGRVAEPVAWTFTTGAPQATLSNQVVFLSDRGGVPNVWAMNPDGTGQHQVSAELGPVVDYAAAPDGSSIVVGDGSRLVYMRADGSDRRVLTDAAFVEFDATYAPDGLRVAFARADASSGRGLGIWEWEVGGGGATELELPDEDEDESASSSPVGENGPLPLRAPTYAPEGDLIAIVDLAGTVVILEPDEDRFTAVDVAAGGAPAWHRSGALLVPLGAGASAIDFEAPIMPLQPAEPVEVGLLRPGRDQLEDAGIGSVSHVAAGTSGRIGWIDAGGRIHVADNLEEAGTIPPELTEIEAAELAFGPVDDVVLVVHGDDEAGGFRIERIDLASGERTLLTRNGWQVRWLP
jgi:hypothetical protein